MDLNLSKSVMDLMFWGRLFHNFGAIFPKALSPNRAFGKMAPKYKKIICYKYSSNE